MNQHKLRLRGVVESEVFLQLYHPEMKEVDDDTEYLAELGLAIMLDKPIIILCGNDRKPLPKTLEKLATKVIYYENEPTEVADEIAETMKEIQKNYANL